MGAQQRFRQMAGDHMSQMQFWDSAKVLEFPKPSSLPLQSNGKAERVMQTLKNCMRKLQVASREEWGRILQLAAFSYRMVLHKRTGFSPFLMMYGQEAIMPEEIPHVTYLSNKNYETAVENHIGRMLAINKKLKRKTRKVQGSLKNISIDILSRKLHPIILWWGKLFK